MASPIEITRDNFHLYLKRSDNPRGSTPNGNVYIGSSIDQLQLIDLTELATVDLGSGLEANPLTNATKVNSLAIYFFLLQEVEADITLQNYRVMMDAVSNRMGKLVGATSFLNGVKLAEGAVDIAGEGGSLGDDRLKISGSGATEFAAAGGGNTLIDRVLHGANSSNGIDAGSQPFFMLALSDSEADRQAAVPQDFSKLGDVNELIQTYGSTANGDTSGDFDYLDYVLFLGVRDYGFSVGEARSSGGAELGAYNQGYSLGNLPVPTVAAITEADVWDVPTVPFSTMAFHRYASAQTETGFVEGDGLFTDYILNPAGGTLIQLRAFMDKLMQQDTDQNANTGETGSYIPKRAEPLYTIDPATAQLVTRKDLFVAGIPAADSQGIVQTAGDGTTRTNPIETSVTIPLSNDWFEDFTGIDTSWLRLMYFDGAAGADFDTDLAVTVQDSSLVEVADVNTPLFADMDINTIAWTAGTTVRITFNSTPNITALDTNGNAKVEFKNNANESNDGKFIITAHDSAAYWIEIDNPLRTDAVDDEATDAPGTADLIQYDARLFKVTDNWEFRFAYAYSTNGQAGLNPAEDKPVILQVGGLNASKSLTKAYIISDVTVSFDGLTDAETN